MARCVLFVSLLGILGFAQSRADDVVKKELAKLDGTWTLVKMESEGKSILQKDEPKAKLIIKDGKVTSDAKGAPKDALELSKVVDPSKDPKRLTIPNFLGGD